MNHDPASILVVDDEESIASLICDALAPEGFRCDRASSGPEALTKLAQRRPDFLLTDVRMPGMSGIELLEQVRAHYPETYVILLTGVADVPMVVRALRAGACDFLTKPFRVKELVERVRIAVQKRDESNGDESGDRSDARLEALQTRYQALSEGVLASFRTVLGLAQPETSAHSERVALRAAALTSYMGSSEEDVRDIYIAGLLHDLGKVTLRQEVLEKPGRLDVEEQGYVQSHSERGMQIVSSLPLPQATLDAIRHHHERFDGSGYPDHLSHEQIPVGARILAVCDAYDAMRSERAYKPELPWEECLDRLRDGAGTQWDPAIVEAFCHLRATEDSDG